MVKINLIFNAINAQINVLNAILFLCKNFVNYVKMDEFFS